MRCVCITNNLMPEVSKLLPCTPPPPANPEIRNQTGQAERERKRAREREIPRETERRETERGRASNLTCNVLSGALQRAARSANVVRVVGVNVVRVVVWWQVAVGKLEKLTVFGDDYDTPDGTGQAEQG
eukprot:2333134-Rhodomonas_salina.1